MELTPKQVANLLLTLAEQAKDIADGEGCEVLRFRTNVRLELRGPDGEARDVLKDVREVHNVICTAGKQQLLKASSAKYLNQFAYCAIGTSTTAASASDTALGTEVARSSVITPTNPDGNTLQFSATFGPGVGTGAITESGLLDASSVGDLLARQVFSAVNKASGDSLTVTWAIT